MMYIHALELVEKCIEHGVLYEAAHGIYICRKKGWCVCGKSELAKELMNDEKGQKLLIQALKEKGEIFKASDLTIFHDICSLLGIKEKNP